MTVSRLQKFYKECDREAAHAFVLEDIASERKWLEVRKAIGRILADEDHVAWKKASSSSYRSCVSANN